jgi:O-antigen/teichoic acid export membrane protein
MHAPTVNATPSRSVLMRVLVRPREYRRPRVWVRVRLAGGAFNLLLGVLLLASGPWLGPAAWLGAVPLAGAALIFWTSYRLQQTVPA